jgi:hypothetical protein
MGGLDDVASRIAALAKSWGTAQPAKLPSSKLEFVKSCGLLMVLEMMGIVAAIARRSTELAATNAEIERGYVVMN